MYRICPSLISSAVLRVTFGSQEEVASTPQVFNCLSALLEVPPSFWAAVLTLVRCVGAAVSTGTRFAVSSDSEPVTVSATATVGSGSAESVAQAADGNILKVSAIVKRKVVNCRVRLVMVVLCPPV